MLTYKEKVNQALSSAETLADIDYIREKVETTEQINRRTIKGRELTEEMLILVTNKEQEIIKTQVPF